MSRRHRPPRRLARPPSASGRQPTPKRQGELAELCFAHRAARLGLVVSKPYGDCAPYDFVVDGAGNLRRVQVKSVSVPDRSAYRVSAGHGGSSKLGYTRNEVDVLAVYVIPADAWYLIPIEELAARRTIRLAPDVPHSRRRFEPYRERWRILGARAHGPSQDSTSDT